MPQQVKQTVIDSVSKVCGYVWVEDINQSELWNHDVKTVIEIKRLHGKMR